MKLPFSLLLFYFFASLAYTQESFIPNQIHDLSKKPPVIKPNSSASSKSSQDEMEIPFSGMWLSENYHEALIKLQSASAAQSKCDHPCGFIIPKNTKDELMLVYNFHEGVNRKIYWSEGKFLIDENAKKNFTEIKPISATRIQYQHKFYFKLSSELSALCNRDFNALASEYLFKGRYKNLSNQGKKNNDVVLTGDGKIKGLLDFKNYFSYIDYYSGEFFQGDTISFSSNAKDKREFGYRFFGKKLKIYNLRCFDENNKEVRCASEQVRDSVYDTVAFELEKY